MLKRSLLLMALVAVLGLLAYGCSNSSNPLTNTTHEQTPGNNTTVMSNSTMGTTATAALSTSGGITVDGNYSDWDLTADFFAEMHRAGDPSKKLESNVYLRYDCATQTMYVLVLTVDGVSGLAEPNNAWVKIGGQTGNIVDGNDASFAWVGLGYDGNQTHVQGYEASFSLAPGSYTIAIHIQVFDDGGSQTSATGTGPSNRFVPLEITCAPPTTATISNYVWADLNGDGIQDSNESGIENVTVNLYDANGNLVASTQTDANGFYSFTVEPGTYTVEFVAPSGYTFSPQGQSGNEATDSDANQTTGKTAPITVSAGDNITTIDAGLVPVTTCDPLAIECPPAVSVQCEGEVPAVDISAVKVTGGCAPVEVTHVGDEVSGTSCDKTITRTYQATDSKGNTVSCTQTITVKDDKAPSLGTPENISVCLESVNGSVVNFTLPAANDNCDPNPTVSANYTSGSTFPLGTTTVTVTATDACGNSSQKTFTVTVTGSSVCGLKFFDANVDGQNNDSKVVSGITINLQGTDSKGNTVSLTTTTGTDGKYCFNNLPLGSYTVSEVLPGSNWVANTATSYSVTVSGCDATVNVDAFGNVCLGYGGGLTLGFWSNKNGQALFGSDDLALMVSLNLRNANGTDFNPTSYSAFRTWLLNATATNMAYMLSAQLAAMQLNVLNGKVSGSSLVYAPGCGNTGVNNNYISINDLIAAANAALGADGYTPSGDPNRAYQECLKIALDKGNNNLNFVQATPCSF